MHAHCRLTSHFQFDLTCLPNLAHVVNMAGTNWKDDEALKGMCAAGCGFEAQTRIMHSFAMPNQTGIFFRAPLFLLLPAAKL